ncbi:MAG: SusD/RagB family nutrient-binding outer membrane lipoprotein [Bacteroidales bacterium]|nr:SusD/RagB family nutrient-binding outer membrane lipoprotein [Bacteroidales bacterium]
MKNIFSKYLLLLIVIFGVSCSNFQDLNTDPATTVTPDVPSLISAVELRLTGERETQWRSTAYFHMGVTQMIADGWTISRGQVYELDYSYVEYMWKSYYQMINNLQIAIKKSEKTTGFENYTAVGSIMKVLLFSQLTDTYGDIPYFEAVDGYEGRNFFPKYDSQEAIYNDFFVQLDKAVLLLDANKQLVGDLIYQGDVAKWKKFANSLRLRLAMRLVNVNETKAKEQATIAVQGGVMSAYTESAYVQHGSYDISQTGMPEIRGNSFSQIMRFSEEIIFGCATYTDYLRDNNDPRFKMMFGIYGPVKGTSLTRVDSKSTTETSVDVTNEYETKYGPLKGQPRASFLFEDFSSSGINYTTFYVDKDGKQIQIDKIFKCLQIRRELTKFDLSAIYLPYSEVELWLAEAAVRGWNLDALSAESHFTKAVNADISQLVNILGATAPSTVNVNTYITNNWNSDPDKLKIINMQHYVCNFFNGIEANANWRRSGYPILKPAAHAKTDPQLNGLIPRRMPYPLTEINYNNAHVSPHLSNGINFWGAPVWWDGDVNRGVEKNK